MESPSFLSRSGYGGCLAESIGEAAPLGAVAERPSAWRTQIETVSALLFSS